MLNIAICDDEQFYVQKIKHLLEILLTRKRVSFHIDTFQSGIDLCKDIKRASKYDMIFLDINMEHMNGIETAEKIRKAGGK
jgi:DNA-binding LytR/AlgR family response regulator